MATTPSSLASAQRKMARVELHQQAVKTQIAEYLAREPYTIEPMSGQGEVLRISEAPPIDIGVLIGEILYHCRSTLDHLLFELVARNFTSAALPAEWEERCQFPLLKDVPAGAARPVQRSYFRHRMLFAALTDEAFAFIERLQPYNNTDASLALRFLQVLSNVDKHRRLNTTVTRVTRRAVAVTPEGYRSTSLSGRLGDGDTFGPAYHPPAIRERTPLRHEQALLPELTFDEPELGPPRMAPVSVVVDVLPAVVARIIVPRFGQLLGSPPPLPA